MPELNWSFLSSSSIILRWQYRQMGSATDRALTINGLYKTSLRDLSAIYGLVFRAQNDLPVTINMHNTVVSPITLLSLVTVKDYF